MLEELQGISHNQVILEDGAELDLTAEIDGEL